MHELSIALGIVDIAENETKKAKKNRVKVIELEIGTLAGIDFDSLDFIWLSAVKNTILEGAERKINIIEGLAKCGDCNHVFPLKEIYESCPKCHSYLKSIINGKELRVVCLEVF